MPPEKSWQVVVMDDEADIRELLTLSLEDAGYEVHTAADGRAGVALVDELRPPLVVTDIRMPRMDGLAVLETVKNEHPDTEVVVATAFGEMELAIRALQLDASDFISKPIDDTALHLALNRAKARYEARRTLREYAALLEREKAATTRELAKTVAFRNNLIEHSMDGILAVDNDDRVVVCNRAMEQLLGRPKDEVLGASGFTSFLTTDARDTFQSALESPKHGGSQRLLLYETTLAGAHGDPIPVQVSAARLLNGEQAHGKVGFFRDLSKIRHLEREMQDQARILHQDKMVSLGRLAASVVHEINNPLSGILNYMRLMLRLLDQDPPVSGPQTDKFRRYLTLVESETERCTDMISSLLTFARKSAPAIQNVSLKRLINRSVLLSRHKLQLNNIEIETCLDADLPPVRGDFNQLQQCLINLIFNALDAMPDGGRVTLRAQADPRHNQVMLSVADTGCGIAEENLPHVFEPFFSTKGEGYGVGLGLSTVYGIVEHHGGSVSIESQIGHGTEFLIRLPIGCPP